jgi:hypothetical protein
MFIIRPPRPVDTSPGSFHGILANFLATGFFAWISAVIYWSLTDVSKLQA